MNEMNTRMGFIGGTDMMKIMDGDWEHLWQIKTGRMQSDDLSNVFAVQLGIATEEFNVSLVEKHTNIKLQRQFQTQKIWDGITLRAVLDGFGFWFGDREEHRIGAECKHTYERNTLDAQLQRYMPQIQFYMWVAELDVMQFACIFGNRDWKMCRVSRDVDYIESLKGPLRNFWEFVLKDKQPQLPHYPVAQPTIDHIHIDDMVKRNVVGDNEFHDRAVTFIETKDSHALHESAKKDLKQMIGHDEREIYSDILAVRRTKAGIRIVQKKEA
tara:strand:- start:145 stop:954 length:810 start_codon:yes stop_codon:yes gene_type:complete